MSKTEEEGKVPQPKLDIYDNPIEEEDDSKLETSKAPTLEELIKKLKKLKAENKKLKVKVNKGKTYSSSSENDDSSCEEGVSNKGGKVGKSMISLLITLCPSITIACQMLPLTLLYLLAKLLILMCQIITNGSIA
jgi:hypothetical protein